MTIKIHADFATKLSLAYQQSGFPVLHELRLENLSETERFENLLVRLTANPPFVKEKTWRVESIPAQATVAIDNRALLLDVGFLLNLRDAMRGYVEIQVERDGDVVANKSLEVELLARNEWGGAGFKPEVLAAFSVPNDPAVDQILSKAGEVLRKAGKEDGSRGYSSGSRQKIWEFVSAVYTAVATLDITYAQPPASFEVDGQKIRLPSQLLEGKIGTCLDTTMLFASVLEQAGLNPIVALPKGHALVGVWLQPKDLSAVVVDEAEVLRKRSELGEMLLFETTCATAHPAPPFSKAIEATKGVMAPERDETFAAAVDIRRARAHRIMPLALTAEAQAIVAEPTEVQPTVEQPFEEAPALPDFDLKELEEEKPQTPEGRLQRWRRRLLDLTRRNNLLNYRAGKSSLKIICPDPGKLEDKLADGARITIAPVETTAIAGQDELLHEQQTGERISDDYARMALEKNQILVDLPKEELDKRAVAIYRKAQTALQEGGSNTLYLALGFLLWKKNEKDTRRSHAPLILLPVTLERKSVRSGIRMVAHGDEPLFNTTLLQLLRQDFEINIDGLDGVLPADESGVDVNGVWNKIRHAVRDAPGFEVVEDVALGHFSFAKYLMWKDLTDRIEALKKNRVVKHLINSPRDPYPSTVDFVSPSQVDSEFAPSDFLTPLPADASQMATVATADRGKDFIVIGPPGTGKSQTISNLIAHMLGKGKSVLFVSEKTAALDVVHRRLKEIGLGKFCLELHSNKTRKTDVHRQLEAAWNASAKMSPEDWVRQANNLGALRDRLNRLAAHLHKKHENGLTAHRAMGVKIRDGELAKGVELSWEFSTVHNREELQALRDVVLPLAIQAKVVGAVREHPLRRLVAHGSWSPQWEDDVVSQANNFVDAATKVAKASDALCKALGVALPTGALRGLDALDRLAKALLISHKQPTVHALASDGQACIEALREVAPLLSDYAAVQKSLSCAYDSFAWRKVDGGDIGKRWEEAQKFWWLKRVFASRSIIKELRREGGAKGNPEPAEDAPRLQRLREVGEAIDRLGKRLSIFREWDGHKTEPTVMLSLAELCEQVRSAVTEFSNPENLVETRQRLHKILLDGNDFLAPQAQFGKLIKEFMDAKEEFSTCCRIFAETCGCNAFEIFADSEQALDDIRKECSQISERRDELRDWCKWRERRAEAVRLGLLPLVAAIERGDVRSEHAKKVFEAAYCTWWSKRVIGEDKVLRTFSAPEHTKLIKDFRALDDQFRKTTAAYIEAGLCRSVPAQGDVTRSSEWGILRRELQKQRRHIPVRQLVQKIPEPLRKLAPCLMMSPLSVAQYLPADQPPFDVVIFDEASQIATWDAVGAIARGNQVVVAGDPKQMPPSNFFARSEEEPDEESESEEDLESILDEMRGANIHELTLNLHYRSRKESLIAFSNNRYYGSSLTTFPAPEVSEKGVRLVKTEGFYVRGKARRNEGEARAIVAEIVRRLTHSDETVREASIGVVTFNSQQQTLIENLLDRARASKPEIEWAFSAEQKTEPVFVKNLETVQGDERDIILFSITYGPDESGRLTMNFGPLNRDGGERRLNVAMTRARSEMIVFSTLDPEYIDLNRTSAVAVRDLKHFLQYAEKGASVLVAPAMGSVGDFESPFEESVADALRANNWEVRPQIGVSAYRIDIGAVHPDKPGVYLAGVECDGAMYHSSSVARDRDKIRQAVLENLGWTLFRVWSTDWWHHKAKALKDLDAALHERLNFDRQKRGLEDAAQEDDDV